MVTAHDYLAQRAWCKGKAFITSKDGERSASCVHLAICAAYDKVSEQRDATTKVCKELGLKQHTAGSLIRWNDHVCATQEQALEALRRAGV